MDTKSQISYQEKALELLKTDAEKIANYKSANGSFNDATMPTLRRGFRYANVWIIT